MYTAEYLVASDKSATGCVGYCRETEYSFSWYVSYKRVVYVSVI